MRYAVSVLVRNKEQGRDGRKRREGMEGREEKGWKEEKRRDGRKGRKDQCGFMPAPVRDSLCCLLPGLIQIQNYMGRPPLPDQFFDK